MEPYDVVLVRSRLLTVYKSVFPPYAALFIGSALKEKGYRVRIFDAQVEDERTLKTILTSHSPLWVGFTDVLTGPAITENIRLASEVRKIDAGIALVWGGPHPTVVPTHAAQHSLVDFACVGEGERTALELTAALKAGRDVGHIPGLAYERDGNVVLTPEREFIEDWDREVFLDWDLVDFDRYVIESGSTRNFPVITSRGCPYRCGFCYNLLVSKRKYRAWSADRTIGELQRLIDRGINHITFSDDNNLINKERFRRIVMFLRQAGVRWSGDNGFRINAVGEEEARLFSETGCDHIAFGAESGSQRILDMIHKDIKAEAILQVANMLKDHGIGAKFSWMVGFPEENPGDVTATLDMIDAINEAHPNVAHYIGLFSPYPGTSLAEHATRKGWVAPSRFEDWAQLREEQSPPYLRELGKLRSIMTSCYFCFSLNNKNRTFSSNLKFGPAIVLLRWISRIRWRTRFFSFPLDFWALSAAKKVLGAMRNRR